jgi:UDPglucose 6-dehydrogenase
MRRIGVVGAGHVGLVTAACFARLGHTVVCADNDTDKICRLKKLEMPFFESGLEDLVKGAVRKSRLLFTSSVAELAKKSEIIFIAVGTPTTLEGRPDLSFVEQVTIEIAKAFTGIKKEPVSEKRPYRLIVEKSTVPVLTGEWVKRTFELLAPTGVDFDIAANPEFLREGSAVHDFFHPDRIVIGTENVRAKKLFEEIYKPIQAPIVFCDIRSAELIKHASNSFLALKISYINAISRICEKVGADVEKVAEGMGYDTRIGKAFLRAGIGYGGSCFPKDVRAFITLAQEIGVPFRLLEEVEAINREQRLVVVRKARELLWNLKDKKICVFGLSFKPDTDDIRESPAIEIANLFLKEGAKIKCYDPKAMDAAKKLLTGVRFCRNPYEAARGCHLLALLTEWKEFKALDFARIRKLMQSPHIVDGRNFLDPEALRKLGFVYRGIGRDI